MFWFAVKSVWKKFVQNNYWKKISLDLSLVEFSRHNKTAPCIGWVILYATIDCIMAIPFANQYTNYGTGRRKGDTLRHFKLRVYNGPSYNIQQKHRHMVWEFFCESYHKTHWSSFHKMIHFQKGSSQCMSLWLYRHVPYVTYTKRTWAQNANIGYECSCHNIVRFYWRSGVASHEFWYAIWCGLPIDENVFELFMIRWWN